MSFGAVRGERIRDRICGLVQGLPRVSIVVPFLVNQSYD